MNLSKFFTLIIVGALFAGSSFAATVSVPGNAATINDALELLDYNDGQADLVLVAPGIYNEQVTPKGNAGADSVRFPRATELSLANIQAAVQTHPDHLTIRGSDPNNPPVILGSNVPAGYGVFPADPGDFFFSNFVYCGKGITMQNVDLRYNAAGDYAKNGMAGDFVWQDCVFSYGSVTGGEDFCDYNNNEQLNTDITPGIGIDNEYIYTNCLIDGLSTVNGIARMPEGFVHWHGYGGDAPGGNAVGDGVTFDNCVVRNYNAKIHEWRCNQGTAGGTRPGLGPILVQDCFFDTVTTQNIFHIRGRHSAPVMIRNVAQNYQGPFLHHQAQDSNQAEGVWVIANNIVKNHQAGGTTPIIRFNNAIDANGQIHIVNNTIDNIGISGVHTAAAGEAGGVLNIANNIFDGTTVGSVGVNISAGNLFTVNVTNNGFFGLGTNVNGTVTETGSVTVDPVFNNRTLTIPATPPTAPVEQGYVPTAAAYINTGHGPSYAAVSASAGNVDVDALNARIGGAGIDIGAQESDGVSLVIGWDYY